MELPQHIATRCLYETLGSDIIERTIRSTNQGIGEWLLLDHLEEDNLVIWRCVNARLPVVFEITQKSDSLELTRARSLFLWEPAFETYTNSWFSDDYHAPEWLDDVMFTSVLPSDFEFGVVDNANFTGHDWTAVHFQPNTRDRPRKDHNDTYDDALEIENAILNVGKNKVWKRFHLYAIENYFRFEKGRDSTIDFLTSHGFNYRPLWIKPDHHPYIKEVYQVS